ncbi:MAG: tetratricopeptide repeat protein [Gammaproteobacteria bacterium]|nr:tetratricopeptide repeat protein [Gammaproteobacteria bacterium]
MKIRHASVQWLAIALLTSVGAVPLAQAQYVDEEKEDKAREITSRSGAASQRARERAAAKAAKAQAQTAAAPAAQLLYPDATRQVPAAKASAKLSKQLQKLAELYDGDKPAEARALAAEIVANGSANAYERAFAAQLGAQAAYDMDDTAGAMAGLKQAIELNGLDNNGHYQAMHMLAQLQLQEERYADALATLDRFLGETRSQKPDHLVLKGNALYRLQRYPEAAAVLKQAVAASPEPRSDWLQLLMGSYFEMKQPAEAVKIGEQLISSNPNDKRLQMNLASIYMQADQTDKAAALLEKLRAGGLLTEDKDYRNLYALYLNMEGKEKEGAAVINDGLQKGVLKPDFQTYQALAQAYYFSEQPGLAINAYAKAAPLAPDGETYLNLAKALWQEGRLAEAKRAAQQALDKGIKKPADAKTILAQGGK